MAGDRQQRENVFAPGCEAVCGWQGAGAQHTVLPPLAAEG